MMTLSEMLIPWEEHLRRLVSRKNSSIPPDHDTEREYSRIITTEEVTHDGPHPNNF